MRMHVLQHVPFEDSANVGRWARRRGHAQTLTRLYRDQPLPPPERLDWLVIVGGPMSVHDDKMFPWLTEEKRLVAECIAAGKTVVGICLGAQLIAQCLGATVKPNRYREIGWHDIHLTDAAAASGLFEPFEPICQAFHWHGETFTLPRGAQRLASSKACRNQAFLYGDRVIGLQFHWDYSAASIASMIAHCGEDLDGSAWVQDTAKLQAGATTRCRVTAELLDGLLDALAGRTV